MGIVAEGATDHEVLQEIIAARSPAPVRFFPLQPDSDATFRDAAGWTEVRAWCADHARWLPRFVQDFYPPLDLLVVHLDADVASQVGVQVEGRATPDITSDLCSVVRGWLGGGRLPEQVLIVLPAQDVEVWLRCSFGGCTPEAERAGNALSWLVRRGELEEVAGQVRKRPVRYRAMAQRLVGVLDDVALACGELRRFLEKLDRHWERLNLNP